MNYKNHKGNKISSLGYGCLRFTKNGPFIDQEKAEREMLLAIENGVNYFDTAYTYGGSETALGKFLAKGYRKDVFIATKLPHYFIRTIDDIEKCFNEQLKRLQTDYIDYYLMHMLNDINVWNRLVRLGIDKWIEEKKKCGRICNIGFSYHGNSDNFIELIDAYDWDICQIQYNYMDEHTQAGVKGLRYAYSKNIPVVIMEPLRGGRLANNMPKSVCEIFDGYREKRSPAEWGLRWLWNQREVFLVLSGMNDREQVLENTRIASEAKVGCMNGEDFEIIEKVKRELASTIKVACTACGYCMPCPFGVDIPFSFRCLNVSVTDGISKATKEYLLGTTLKKQRSNASLCRKCGQCEKKCPQGLPIREKLDEVKRVIEHPIYKIIAWGGKTFGRF